MVNKLLSNVMPTYGNKTFEFIKGKGCYLYTSQNKKYLDLNINAKTDIRIARFKELRVLISGEVRSPGVYSFPAYIVGDFKDVNNVKEKSKNIENLFFMFQDRFGTFAKSLCLFFVCYMFV